jgi:hypothetical protein
VACGGAARRQRRGDATRSARVARRGGQRSAGGAAMHAHARARARQRTSFA